MIPEMKLAPTPEADVLPKMIDLSALVRRLEDYIKNMNSRIIIARSEIREKQSALLQLEQEKWNLESEVDKISAMVTKANAKSAGISASEKNV
jgi:hypothetical protein